MWRPANGFFLLSILMWFFGSGTMTPFLFWSNGNGAERKRYWTTFNQFDLQSKQQDESLHLTIWSTYWDCLTCFANHFHLVFYLKLPRSWRTRYEHLANQLLFYSTRLQLSGNWFIPHFYQMFCYHHQVPHVSCGKTKPDSSLHKGVILRSMQLYVKYPATLTSKWCFQKQSTDTFQVFRHLGFSSHHLSFQQGKILLFVALLSFTGTFFDMFFSLGTISSKGLTPQV